VSVNYDVVKKMKIIYWLSNSAETLTLVTSKLYATFGKYWSSLRYHQGCEIFDFSAFIFKCFEVGLTALQCTLYSIAHTLSPIQEALLALALVLPASSVVLLLNGSLV
jgi:hypothetical protein